MYIRNIERKTIAKKAKKECLKTNVISSVKCFVQI